MAAGVVAPLGMIIFGTLGFLACREWKRNQQVEELVAQRMLALRGGEEVTSMRYETKEHILNETLLELETDGSGQRGELDASRGPFHETGIQVK